MRHKKQYWIPFVAFLVLATICTTAYAQPSAAQIVSSFNGMNGNQGFIFTNQTLNFAYHQRLSTSSGSNPDTSAYGSGIGGANYFQTFCIQPNISSVAYSGTATLNYDAATGTTSNSSGIALTFGAAYLYSKYATGALVVTDDNVADFYMALNTVNGYFSQNWNTNDFLRELRYMESDLTYWTREYDPGKIYLEIGEYSVFVVSTSVNGSTQDVLYLARSSGSVVEPPPPSGVPEPTAMLLWVLGCFGMTGTTWIRNRKKKKLAFA